MKNRCVITSAEGLAYGWQAGRCKFLGKPHGDLAWAGNDTSMERGEIVKAVLTTREG